MLPIAHAIFALTAEEWKTEPGNVIGGRERAKAALDAPVSAEERAALDSLYEEIIDNDIPVRKMPEYAYDMHVCGYSAGAIIKFVIDEQAALSPLGKVPDPYYKLALEEGVPAREAAKSKATGRKGTARRRSKPAEAPTSGTTRDMPPTAQPKRKKQKEVRVKNLRVMIASDDEDEPAKYIPDDEMTSDRTAKKIKAC